MRARWNDALNLLSSLTLRRLINAGRLYISYFRSKATGVDHHHGFPMALSIEPTTSCNLRCPECPSGLRAFSRPTGMLSTELNKRIIDQVGKDLIYLTYYFQGEPYLNPEFLDMVRYASDNKVYTATSTNAHYLSETNAARTIESGLKRLIISIDGSTQDTYGKYRIGGSLDKVIEGTRNLVEAKKRTRAKHPHIIWQFIVFGHNEHQIEEVKHLGKEVGVDEVAVKTAQIYDFEKGSDLIPLEGEYARYEKVGNGYRIKNELLNHCWRMWHAPVVTWDGKVVPCCFDKDAQHGMGNLQENDFQTIWSSASYKNFRQSILRSRSEIDICKNCTEGTKVWM